MLEERGDEILTVRKRDKITHFRSTLKAINVGSDHDNSYNDNHAWLKMPTKTERKPRGAERFF